MAEHVGMAMLMGIKWKHSCTFIFEEWSVQNVFPYIVGLLISAVVAMATIALPYFKTKIVGRSSKKQSLISNAQANQSSENENSNLQLIRLTIYYFLYSTLHVSLMLLFMTYNGGVVLSLMLGMILGHWIFRSKDTDSDLPINCCSNHA